MHQSDEDPKFYKIDVLEKEVSIRKHQPYQFKG